LALRGGEEEDRERKPSAALADVRELCVEFRHAIAALTANDIASLETSTATQDLLVQKLQDCFRGQAPGQQPPVTVFHPDFKELVKLNKVYSSLLQRALRTTRLRAALCQTYRQNFPAESAPAAASGWSCEA
jgi:hypothetical protein